MINHMTDSHILVNDFTLCEPVTVDEAIALLAEHGSDARAMSGGTDLLVHMKMERTAPDYVVSLNRIQGLAGVHVEEGRLRIGALTTIADIASDPDVRRECLALAEACDSFSTRQVQVMATIGGNLCNGSPASDTAPALMALSADVELRGPEGVRYLPLRMFLKGPGKTALHRGEVLTQVLVPRPAPAPKPERVEDLFFSADTGTGSAFLKIGRVSADIAKASAAVLLVRDGERVVHARLAFGAVGPTPMRARGAEARLTGRPFDASLAEDAARLAAEEVSPIDDVRSEAWYRRAIVQVMARDGLERAWRRAGGQFGLAWESEAHRPVSDSPSHPFAGPSARRDIPSPCHPLAAGSRREVTLRVNDGLHRVWVAPNDLLLNVLREKLELTGSKYGCGIGECSACTVQMDGRPVLACLVLAATAEGHDIRTVEGLEGPNGELDPLQEAFIEHAAFQCGYCTPGMLMTAKSLLAENPRPAEDDVRHYLRGNLCRCTGYAAIVRAVLSCSAKQVTPPA